jgi:N-glycosylase/DNA lyase
MDGREEALRMNIARYSDGIIISGLSDFSLAECLTSGQTFRWQPQGAGFCGVALGRAVYAEQRGDALLLSGVGIKDADAFVRYFDLERDYGAVKAAYAGDPFLREGMGYAPGMRVLRQPHFETLISFIISANNNLRRIMGIVERLCARCGAPIEGGFDFPTPGALAALGEDALREIGAGYRARFIAAAARAVAEGFSLDDVARMPYEEARQTLAKLPGVGLKVADCVALYGMGFTQAFPADVWMRRVLCGVYGYRGKNDKQLRAFVDDTFGECAGLAQQYLFHYARHHREAVCR